MPHKGGLECSFWTRWSKVMTIFGFVMQVICGVQAYPGQKYNNPYLQIDRPDFFNVGFLHERRWSTMYKPQPQRAG